jgi:pyruvate dehydrogenase E2 component (dihydrolipoamide acetyltransferase)
MAELIMPKMGDAMEEGRIVQWLKNVGDTVKAGEPVVEIETDKSNVEVEAEEAGTIQSIAFPAGEVAPVGATIAVIGQGAAPAASAPAPAAPKVETPAPTPATPAASANGNGSAPAAPAVATPAPAQVAPVQVVAAAEPFKPYDSFVGAFPENLGGSSSVIGEPITVAGGGAANGDGRVKATPVAKAMAQANGISLAALRGTGPDGGIVKKDVEAALAGGGAAPAVAAPTAPAAAPAIPASTPAGAAPAVPVNDGDEVQEYNGMRRTIARRLSESKSTIPHFYVTTEIDMEALIKLREQVNANAGENGVKVSINDCLIKAVAVALAENPKLNSVFSDNKRIVRKAINVGFGVSVADGLIVPVVKNCENLSLRAVARTTKPLIEKARSGKLAPADYSGGTFTISNMGVFPDIEEFQAIVNPGEGAILAVASTRTVPAVVGDQIVPRKRMKVSLSADHRIVDGADGAQFLITLKRVIENPLEMLA